ncbi:MAG TPA: class I SAM-dependent methyltransferase [Candidatus Spyradenecus faecavium]|uniref:Class I SAM-dependent methyltransferase n=1 Tax=Candidatus Spyradenecus faecavium TaxID=2840947 RepID=A0A9D1NPM4_9BACT|nr:class I SAM-dependent methyltransferase [Candidatus Spyradenecus faecavium]
MNGYELLDSGNGAKLERFGEVVLARPCAQAVWQPQRPARWKDADATFDREEGNRWHGRSRLPKEWAIDVDGTRFRLSGTDFGHLGIFPEQRAQWAWIRETVAAAHRPLRVLNLFAYSGGSTLAAARAGAEVCHLDASKGMVQWARANAALNGLESHPIRWIVDDAHKFLNREVRRGRRYDGIILDPPTYGRGGNGETYKIERDLTETLRLCRALLSDAPRFLLLSAHTPGHTPVVLSNVLTQALRGLGGAVSAGEMLLTGAPDVFPLPSGAYARWQA